MSKSGIVQVLYPQSAAEKFDMAYYLGTHMPLVEKTWGGHGLKNWTVTTYPKDNPNSVQAILFWESLDAYHNAPGVDIILGDIKNFTETSPTFWESDVQGLNILKQ